MGSDGDWEVKAGSGGGCGVEVGSDEAGDVGDVKDGSFSGDFSGDDVCSGSGE